MGTINFPTFSRSVKLNYIFSNLKNVWKWNFFGGFTIGVISKAHYESKSRYGNNVNENLNNNIITIILNKNLNKCSKF